MSQKGVQRRSREELKIISTHILWRWRRRLEETINFEIHSSRYFSHFWRVRRSKLKWGELMEFILYILCVRSLLEDITHIAVIDKWVRSMREEWVKFSCWQRWEIVCLMNARRWTSLHSRINIYYNYYCLFFHLTIHIIGLWWMCCADCEPQIFHDMWCECVGGSVCWVWAWWWWKESHKWESGWFALSSIKFYMIQSLKFIAYIFGFPQKYTQKLLFSGFNMNFAFHLQTLQTRMAMRSKSLGEENEENSTANERVVFWQTLTISYIIFSLSFQLVWVELVIFMSLCDSWLGHTVKRRFI